MPCDTGSDVEELKKVWPDEVDWSMFDGEEEGLGDRSQWRSKEGVWAPGQQALENRAKWVRQFLKRVIDKGGVDHVVCVLHGGVSCLTSRWRQVVMLTTWA